MKYLNNTDLYFRIGDIDTGLTPTNANQAYTIQVMDKNNHSTILKRYDGQIFYYTNNQRIYYDFLVDMCITELDLSAQPHSESVIPVADVMITFSGHTKTDVVARFNLSDFVLSSEADAIVYPSTATTVVNVSPEMFRCDTPKVVYGQNYPAIVYTGSYTPVQTDTVDCACMTSYAMIKNGVYVFPFTEDEDIELIKAVVPSKSVMSSLSLPRTCNPHYMLVWYDPQGFFQSQPFWGSKEESYTHNSVTNLHRYETKYQTQDKRNWTLKSDWVRNQKTYESLFISPVIWLYDTKTCKYHKVLVTKNTFAESRSRKPYKFNITVTNDHSTIYK